MDNAPVRSTQRVYCDGFSLTLGFFTEAQRHVFQRSAPALTVVLDIYNNVWAFAPLSVGGDARDQVLERFQRLSLASNDETAVVGSDFQQDFVRFLTRPYLHRRVQAHEFQNLQEHASGLLPCGGDLCLGHRFWCNSARLLAY